MTLKGAFTADVDAAFKNDLDRTLEDMPLIKDHFFTSGSKMGIVIKAACQTPGELTDLQNNLGQLAGLSNLKAWTPEETGLSRIQKTLLVRSLALAGVTYLASMGLIFGANPVVDFRYLFLVPIVTAASAFFYELYYRWPK